MSPTSKSVPMNPYWLVGDLFAMTLGVCLVVLLSPGDPSSILDNTENIPLARVLAHYMFHPLTYAAVAAIFAFRIIQNRFAGFWSIFGSLILGGLLTSLVLSLK